MNLLERRKGGRDGMKPRHKIMMHGHRAVFESGISSTNDFRFLAADASFAATGRA